MRTILLDLPIGCKGFIVENIENGEQCCVLNARYNHETNMKTYQHECEHARHGDLACCEAGFNPTSFLTFLRRNDKLDTEGRALTKRVRINGRKCQCVVLKKDMDDMGFEEIDENEQVAF